MRPLLVLLVLGCGNDRTDPGVAGPPALPAGEARQSIDVVTTVPEVAIRGVEVTPRAGGDLEVTYRVDATGAALVPARTMCRVGEHNVVYPETAVGKVAGPRLSSLYRADPFSERATVCEITFLYAPDAQTPLAPIGHACFDTGVLHDGRCAAARFPAPELPTASAVVLERVALELHDASATVTALFTLAQPLAADRRFAAALHCTDAAGKLDGDAALTFVPLDSIPVGASIFGPVTFALGRTPAANAECTVDIVSRTVGDGPAGERIHAQYCVTSHSVRVGRC